MTDDQNRRFVWNPEDVKWVSASGSSAQKLADQIRKSTPPQKK